MPVNIELLGRLLAPISETEPSGKDLRYDNRYDAIKEARREDMDLPGGELDGPRKVADWNLTVKLASELLEQETKDLQLAAWLTEALLRKDGISGLTTGLQFLEGLLKNHWDTLYPVMEDDDPELRTGPLEWVGSRLDIAVNQSVIASGGISALDYVISKGIPSENEADNNSDKKEEREEALSSGKKSPEEVDSAIESTSKAFYRTLLADTDESIASLAALEATSDDRFGRDAPGFSNLKKSLENTRQLASSLLARKLESDPDPEDEASEEVVEAAGELLGEDGTISSEVSSARDAALRIAASARYLRKQDPSHPAAYLLVRGYRWGELRATPGELDPRLLEAPATAARAKLKGLMLDGRWQELLEQGEVLMATPQGRGWLDLQRYTLTACSNLGDAYDGVSAVVRSELKSLLAALPNLPNMTLMDDTPVANGETREWLESEGILPTDTTESSAQDEQGSADDASEQDDSPADDGTEALEQALDEEEATASNGGLERMPSTRRAAARKSGASVGSRDPFSVARNELALGRPNKAIEIMVAQHSRERSPRGRFVRQTQIAFLMVQAGLETVARPMLERLVQIIEERSLEEWEAGPLVAQPMALLCKVYDKLDVNESERYDLYLRVCRLDPLQALAIQKD